MNGMRISDPELFNEEFYESLEKLIPRDELMRIIKNYEEMI